VGEEYSGTIPLFSLESGRCASHLPFFPSFPFFFSPSVVPLSTFHFGRMKVGSNVSMIIEKLFLCFFPFPLSPSSVVLEFLPGNNRDKTGAKSRNFVPGFPPPPPFFPPPPLFFPITNSLQKTNRYRGRRKSERKRLISRVALFFPLFFFPSFQMKRYHRARTWTKNLKLKTQRLPLVAATPPFLFFFLFPPQEKRERGRRLVVV